MTLLERNQQILRQCQNLQPVAEPIRQLLIEGKREQLLAGVDAAGSPFAPLAQSTLRHRMGDPTPLVPRGSSSTIIVRYEVTVRVESGRITAAAGWPGVDWVQYHKTGTRRMPRRDPTGFRPADLDRARTILRDHVLGR